MTSQLLSTFASDRPVSAPSAPPHTRRTLAGVALLGVLVTLGSAAPDLWLGAPARRAPATNQAEPPALRSKPPPADAEAWKAQGRADAALGHHAQAMAAFETAATLRPADATLLAEHAFSAAVLDPEGATGDAVRLVERALQLDPMNTRALALAGTLALDRKDYPAAVRHWSQLVQAEPIGSPRAREARSSITQAQHLADAQTDLTHLAAASPAVRPRGTP